MSRPSLENIATRYGRGDDFGHYDYQKAREAGYSRGEILNWVNQDLNRLAPGNRPGGRDGLYEEMNQGNVDYNKSVIADRGGLSGAEIEEARAERNQLFDLQRIEATGRANAMVQQVIADARKYAADSELSWRNYGADRQVDATRIAAEADERSKKYVADVSAKSASDVATIRGEYGLSLQKIVNAGARDVEKIRGEFDLGKTKMQGEYGLEGERIRGATQRDVAQRQKDASIFGSLVSGFWS